MIQLRNNLEKSQTNETKTQNYKVGAILILTQHASTPIYHGIIRLN